MFRRIFAKPAIAVLLCAAALPAASHRRTGENLLIEPAKAWVGLARVHLEVSELSFVDDELEGRYRIRVPLIPSENDQGTIRLRPSDTLERLRQSGGTLVGRAQSGSGNQVRLVFCEVGADGTIRIDVTTERRTVSFRTRYRAAADG